VCLLALVATVASPVFDNGFVYDDDDVIENGDVIHDPSEVLNLFRNHTMYVSPQHRGDELHVDTYRPVTLVSFMWDSAISGRDPWAYHLTNLVMHLICTVLVFLFVKELLGTERWPFALFASAWFALSPHPSSAHIWINGRSDLFCTALGLGAILIWRRALGRSEGLTRASLIALSAGLFFAGLLSKESLLFALPAIVLWPERSTSVSWLERLRRSAGFAVAGVGYLAVRAAVLGGLRSNEGTDHLLKALSYLAPLELEGLWGALWPRRLYLRFLGEELGAFSALQLTAFGLVFALFAAAAWLMRRRLPLIVWGLFWFVSCLAPVAIIAGLLWPGFGRYLYLPSAGLAVAVGSVAVHLHDGLGRWRRALALIAVAYLAMLAVHLHGWVQDYRDRETLYTAAITKNPKGAHGYGWLGMYHFKEGRIDDAIGPLTVAHQLAPDEVRYAECLFDAFVKTQRYKAAGRLAEESAPRYERSASSFHMFLLNASHMDNPETASFHVLECLRKDPGSADCGKALERLLTEHPMKLRYRDIVRTQLEQERLAAVRRQTDPLMRSLP
jgi:tetratricopeptide (TPR) repeat protein